MLDLETCIICIAYGIGLSLNVSQYITSSKKNKKNSSTVTYMHLTIDIYTCMVQLRMGPEMGTEMGPEMDPEMGPEMSSEKGKGILTYYYLGAFS